ncbi:MAG: hypothetical protein ABTA16_17980, partial [Niallia sp.]
MEFVLTVEGEEPDMYGIDDYALAETKYGAEITVTEHTRTRFHRSPYYLSYYSRVNQIIYHNSLFYKNGINRFKLL